MKLFVTLAACLVVLGSSAISSRAAAHHPARLPIIHHPGTISSVHLSTLDSLLTRPRVSAAAILATGTVTTTATGTSSAIPTPTTSPYPDPQTVLGNAFTVLGALNSTHFENVIDFEKTGLAKLHIDVTGDASCNGPSMKGHLAATYSLEGTSQTSSRVQDFVWIKNKAWLKSNATHKKWAKFTKTSLTNFGLQLTFKQDLFPLLCAAVQFTCSTCKDLVNLGPDTFQGVPVWHIHGTLIGTDPTTNQTFELPFDFLVSQDHFLPYVQSTTATDPTTNVTQTSKVILTKFGAKVAVTDPTKKKKA